VTQRWRSASTMQLAARTGDRQFFRCAEPRDFTLKCTLQTVQWPFEVHRGRRLSSAFEPVTRPDDKDEHRPAAAGWQSANFSLLRGNKSCN
jgi:hypothetical protein